MIRNTTKKTLLAQRQRILGDILSQAVGLMFSRRKSDFGLVFSFKSSEGIMLHNWFVFYSLDLIFLDSGRNVVEIRTDFRPFACHRPKRRFSYLIEVVSGRVKATRTTLGDKITF